MKTLHSALSHLSRPFAHASLTAWLAIVGLVAPSNALAQAFQITSIQRVGGQILIEHQANPSFYYVLNRIDLKTGAGTPVNIARAFGSAGQVTDFSPPATSGFYRVKSVPLSSPEDTDGDGMDDVYEIDKEYLNPLDPSDASRINSATGLTELQTYIQDPRSAVLYTYLVGTGMADVTGPAAEGGMMGYADGEQKSVGIHDRQWARAFIAAGREPGAKRVAFVTVEAGQLFHSVTQGVYLLLQAHGLGSLYPTGSIVLSATHTHGGAGGQSHFPIYNLNTGGFSWQAYDAQVHGIYTAIKRAHDRLAPGRIRMSKGRLSNASESRARTRFRLNPEITSPNLSNPFAPDDRDTEMLCLRFDAAGGKELGMLNWFPVHPVSFSQKNRLLTGDNKGLASYLFESEKGTYFPGHFRPSRPGEFVAGFANSNEGDITSNLWTNRSAWPAGVKRWPGNNENDLLRVTTIGTRQYEKARELFSGPTSAVSGPVDYKYMYLSLALIPVLPQNLYPYNVPGVGFTQSEPLPIPVTFRGANGVDQLAGTLDGPGLSQGVINAASLLKPNLVDLTELVVPFGLLHYPKDVMIDTSRSPAPEFNGVTVGPTVLPISILRIGNLAILAVPAEFTSMAGWRLRKSVESILPPGTQTIIAGLSNDYSGYVTTYEEYLHIDAKPEGFAGQSYEAASTQFGAFTLAAYQTKFTELAQALVDGTTPTTLAPPATREDNLPVGGFFLTDAVVNNNDPAPDTKPGGQTAQLYTRAIAAGPPNGATCPPGQTYDSTSNYCWRVPAGYMRTGSLITEHTACVLENPLLAAVNFGDLVQDATTVWVKPASERVFRRGETVSATFWGGHPKNVFGTKTNRTLNNNGSLTVPSFMEVQRATGPTTWERFRTDADWDTTFRWERSGSADSKCTVTWCVGGTDVTNGTYRLAHRGVWKRGDGVLTNYEGFSPTFTVSD
jgi:neutral ceramidase